MKSIARSACGPLGMAGSIQTEMRDILESAVKPQGRIRLGSMLAEIGRKVKLTEGEFAIFESVRDKTASRAATFE